MTRISPRSFTSLLSFLLALALAGCTLPDSASSQNSIYDLYPPAEDDPDADDDEPALPDDDDADDDLCEDIDRDVDFDCDGIRDVDDRLMAIPGTDVVAFHMSTVDWADSDEPDQISAVGYGFGGDDDWSFLGINPLAEGNWWTVALEDGDYRMTLRGPGANDWADYHAYCLDSGDPLCCFNPNDSSYAAGVSVEDGVAEPGDCPSILEKQAQVQ